MSDNRINELFQIKYPIISGGMIWHSGWRLASAVSNAGGLGLIGAGSMYPDVLREHIEKCQKATDKPFGVNVPMLYPNIEEIIQIILETGVKIIFTSAGNPKTYTETLKKEGRTVAHVVSSTKFAVKSEDAGVDAIVAEGFEAGGHNGREETTTLVLIPKVREAVSKPLIAAGGIATGSQMKAVMMLGADGVQLGSRFAASAEASGHPLWKEKIETVQEGDTMLSLKELAPVRLVKNEFYQRLSDFYQTAPTAGQLKEFLGRGRGKKGMFEGDLQNGELEIGQAASLIDKVLPVNAIFEKLLNEYRAAGVPEL